MTSYDPSIYRSADAVATRISVVHQLRVVATRDDKAIVVHDLTRTVSSVPTTAKPFSKVWYLEILQQLDQAQPLTPEPDEYRVYTR